MKYVKLIVEDNIELKQVTSLMREFASSNFKKSTIYAWDTERTDDTYTVSFPEPSEHVNVKPCGRSVGKVAGRHLICGADDYLCPDCKPQ